MENLEEPKTDLSEEEIQTLKDKALEELYNELDEGEEVLHLLSENIKDLENYYVAVNTVLERICDEIEERRQKICGKEKCAYDCVNDEHCHEKEHRTEDTKDKKYCEHVKEDKKEDIKDDVI